MTQTLMIKGLALGVIAGVMSGLMGFGGGVIPLPAMVLLLGFSQHAAKARHCWSSSRRSSSARSEL